MLKKRFEKPEMEKIAFEAEDIITSSATCGSDSDPCPSDCIWKCKGQS